MKSILFGISLFSLIPILVEAQIIHTKEIHSISLSPNDSLLVAADQEGKISIWTTEGKQLIDTVRTGSTFESFLKLSISNKGDLLTSNSTVVTEKSEPNFWSSPVIQMWGNTSGKYVMSQNSRQPEVLFDFDVSIGRVFMAFNGYENNQFKESTFLIITPDSTGENKAARYEYRKKITCVQLSPSGEKFIMGFSDGSFEIRESNSNKVVAQSKLQKGCLIKAEFDLTEKTVYLLPLLETESMNRQCDTHIWQFNLVQQKVAAIPLSKETVITDFDLASDGKTLAVLLGKTEVVIWSPVNRKELFTKYFYSFDQLFSCKSIQVSSEKPIFYLAGSDTESNGKLVAFNYRDSSYYNLGTKPGPRKKIYPAFVVSNKPHLDSPKEAAMGVDQKIYVTNSYDAVSLWDVASGRLIKTYDSLSRKRVDDPNDPSTSGYSYSMVSQVSFSETAKILAVRLKNAYDKDRSHVLFISTDKDSILWETDITVKGFMEKPDMHLSALGNFLVFGHNNEETDVLIINIPRKEVLALPTFQNEEALTCISPDEKWIIIRKGGYTSYSESDLIVYSLEKKKIVKSGKFPDDNKFIAFVPGTSTALMNFKQVSIPEIKNIWTQDVEGYPSGVIGYHFEQDKNLLYLALKGNGQSEYIIKVWNLTSGIEISSTNFTSDKELEGWMISDGVAHFPYLETNTFQKVSIPLKKAEGNAVDIRIVTQTGHYDQITQVGYSPNQKYAFSYGYDNRAKVIDLKTGKELITVEGVSSPPQFDHTSMYLLCEKGLERQLVDITTGLVKQSFKNLNSIFLSEHNSLVAILKGGGLAMSLGKSLEVIDYETGAQPFTFHGSGAEEMIVSAKFIKKTNLLFISTVLTKNTWKYNGYLVDYIERKIVKQVSLEKGANKAWMLNASEMITSSGEGLYKLNLSTGKESLLTRGSIVDVHPESGKVVVSDHSRLKFLSINSGKELKVFCKDSLMGCSFYPNSVAISPDGKRVLVGEYARVMEFEIENEFLIRTIQNNVTRITGLSFDPSTASLAILSFSKNPLVLDLTTGSASNPKFGKGYEGTDLFRTSKGFNHTVQLFKDTLAYAAHKQSPNSDVIRIGRLNQDKAMANVPGFEFKFSADRKRLLIANKDSIKLYDAKTLRVLEQWKGNPPMNFSTEGKWIVSIDEKKVVVRHGVTGKFSSAIKIVSPYTYGYNSIEMKDGTEEIFIASDNQRAQSFTVQEPSKLRYWKSNEVSETNIFLSWSDYVVVAPSVYSFRNEDKVGSLIGHSDDFSAITESEHLFFTGSRDGTVKIWRKTNSELVATLVVYDSAGFIIFTPDNYYFSSRNGTKGIAFKVAGEIYPFEQFDLSFNRPDIILHRLGFANDALLNAYKKAFQKRVTRSGLNPDSLSRDIQLPHVAILNNPPGSAVRQQNFKLQIKGNDDNHAIAKLSVWINNVPLFGSGGFKLKGSSTQLEQTINVLLNNGKNKIQVSVTNSVGVESLRESMEVTYQPEISTKPDLHVIILSVSNYKDARFNLKYAVKDGRDMAAMLSKRTREFNKIRIDTLYNEKVSAQQVSRLKTNLLSIKPDDHVIIFASGHGLLDKDLNFYFAGYDTDFQNPSVGGIPYEMIEGLLDSIPARQKLLLFDACHSGEVDKEDEKGASTAPAASATTQDARLQSTSFKGTASKITVGSRMGLKNSIEIMQELFVDVQNRSGSLVISAAAGNSFALESPKWNNGVFTYVAKEGLLEMKADYNHDGQISILELQRYLCTRSRRNQRITKAHKSTGKF